MPRDAVSMPAAGNPLLPGWPSGPVTFLYTDVKGSTTIAGALHDADYEPLKEAFRRRLREQTEAQRGKVYSDKGDGIIGVFGSVREAVAAAVAVQRSLRDDPIPDHEKKPLQMRMGIHRAKDELNLPNTPAVPANREATGDFEGEATHPNYGTEDLNFASRIEALADAGQILLSESAAFDFRGNGTDDAPTGRPTENWTLYRHPLQRLKGVSGGHVVYDLLYDGRGPQDPGLHFAPSWYRGELNRFIPRDDHAATIFGYFDEKATTGFKWRIVLLRGAGGMGKTRLAMYCAAQMGQDFPGGVHFVSLSVSPDAQPVPQPVDEIARRVATALSLPQSEGTPEGVIAWANALTEPTLLLLDNAESLAGQNDAERSAVNRFWGQITRSGMCRLLITSRKHTGPDMVTQEVSLNQGMTEPQARALFVSLARQRNDHYAINDEAAFDRICRATECIPLSVTLAAKWATKRSLQNIADGLEKAKLGDYAQRPAGSGGDVDDDETFERHVSVRASIDWSFHLLTNEEKAVLPLCGLFDAPFLRGVVADVADKNCDAPLDGIQDASLVLFDPDTDRYSLHASVRDYAREKFAARPDADNCRTRFIAHYAKLFGENDGSTSADMNRFLSIEWPNFVAAHGLSIEAKQFAAMMQMLTTPYFVQWQGFVAEWKAMLEKSLACGPELDSIQMAELNFLFGGALQYLPTGDMGDNLEKAIQRFNQASDIFRQNGDLINAAKAKASMGDGVSERISGDIDANQREAREIYEEVGMVFTRDKDPSEWAKLQRSIALTYFYESSGNTVANVEAQIRHLEAARSAINIETDKGLYAGILASLGIAYTDSTSGNLAENINQAIAYQKEAIHLYEDMGHWNNWASAQLNLGVIYSNNASKQYGPDKQTFLEHAISCYEKATTVYTEKAYPRYWAAAMENIGIVLEQMGDINGACQKWREARRGYVEVKHTAKIKKIDEWLA